MQKSISVREKVLGLVLPIIAIIGLAFVAPLGASEGAHHDVTPANPSTEMVGLGLYR